MLWVRLSGPIFSCVQGGFLGLQFGDTLNDEFDDTIDLIPLLNFINHGLSDEVNKLRMLLYIHCCRPPPFLVSRNAGLFIIRSKCQ